jgi:hypothetical protein
MNTFKTGLLETDIEFEYQAGSVSTKIPWYQPTDALLNKFVKTIKKIENYDKYDLFLVGGVVNGNIGKTWDVDIIVCGDIIPEQFEKFLHDLYHIALNKFNILVDVRWFNVPVEHHNNLVNANKVERVKSIRFGTYRKKIGDSESITNLFEKGNKITENLVELEVTIPSKKAFEYKNGNKYIKL